MRRTGGAVRPVDVVVAPLRPILLIGSFDGVHRHSTELIEHARAAKHEDHPLVAVVVHVVGTSHLTSVERTCELLVQQGVDTARAVTIDTTSGLDALRRLLVELDPISAEVDPDLEPDVALLVRVAACSEGIRLQHPSSRTSLDTGTSSTIRCAVRIGDIALANRLLGRPHRLPVALQSNGQGVYAVECLDPGAERPPTGNYLAVVGVAGQHHLAELTVGSDTFVLSFTGPTSLSATTPAAIDFLDRADIGITLPDTIGSGGR